MINIIRNIISYLFVIISIPFIIIDMTVFFILNELSLLFMWKFFYPPYIVIYVGYIYELISGK
jgi:hypothetical protein